LKSKEYINFVVSKIENDLKIYSNSGELLKCMYVLGVLKNSENLLKDIYAISRIKNFKSLGNYLLFILKKTETGDVRFDNLIENLNLDKKFILNELMSRFRIDAPVEEGEPHEITRTPKIEETKEEKITGEIKKILAGSKFKVEEIDNELVTEEFIETEVKEDNDLIVRGNYLELLQPDGAYDEDSVFSMPTDKPKEDEETFIEEDVFALPGEKKETEETVEQETEEIKSGNVNTDEREEVVLDKIEEESAEVTEVEDIEEVGSDKEHPDTESVEAEEVKEELIPEEEFEKEEIPQEEIIFEEASEEKIEEVKQELKEEEEAAKEKEVVEEAEIIADEVSEQTHDEEELTVTENSVYMQYETELMERNAVLCAKFDELKSLNKEDENFGETKEAILKEIIDNSAYLEEYSQKMSFEVITSVYNVMNMTFVSFGKTVGGEILALFKNSIALVESLIKGEDFVGFDSIIKSLEALKHTLLENKKEEEKEETVKPEKEITEELEMPAGEKYLDTNQRQKLALLKQNIIEVENVFKSLEEIKGKYQAYEALRRLSHTFTHLKEMVNIANILEMRKVAQLAEASYIFVKFVQNYRMDPFESEISEVFKYIIYNFKLIFLDKPTKDIDLLISYLNDPVKIFEKKEKK
jgi:hypothetical protein